MPTKKYQPQMLCLGDASVFARELKGRDYSWCSLSRTLSEYPGEKKYDVPEGAEFVTIVGGHLKVCQPPKDLAVRVLWENEFFLSLRKQSSGEVTCPQVYREGCYAVEWDSSTGAPKAYWLGEGVNPAELRFAIEAHTYYGDLESHKLSSAFVPWLRAIKRADKSGYGYFCDIEAHLPRSSLLDYYHFKGPWKQVVERAYAFFALRCLDAGTPVPFAEMLTDVETEDFKSFCYGVLAIFGMNFDCCYEAFTEQVCVQARYFDVGDKITPWKDVLRLDVNFM